MDPVIKLIRLSDKASLTVTDVTFAVDNWENADFPRKLETKVRRWFKDTGCQVKYAYLQVAYAKMDEQSAKWLIDPCKEAQLAIIGMGDEDDLALLVKNAPKYSELALKLWKLVAESDVHSERVLSKLAAREDAPAKFVSMFSAEKEPATQRKPRRPRIVEEKPAIRGRTGSSRRVVKPSKVSDEIDQDDKYSFRGEKPVKKVVGAKPGKTVNKTHRTSESATRKPSSAIEKIRKVVKPAKPVRGAKITMERNVNENKVRKAARVVRRPRV